MKNLLKKIGTDIKLLWYSLFYGLKSGNDIISQKNNKENNGIEISATMEKDNIMQDFIRGEETQRVKETRDELYRVLDETETLTIDRRDTQDGETALKVRKKTAADYAIKIDVFNPEKLPIRLIQDNKFYDEGNSFSVEDIMIAESKKNQGIFTIERDGFAPRFKIEDYAKKLVVRINGEKNVLLDFYCNEYASQFGKIDALFVKQLYDIKTSDNKKSDITTFDKLSFITDKSTGEHSLYEFVYDNITYKEINVFDGNFVLTFNANVVTDGVFVGKKFETKELSKKLINHEQRDKEKAIDAETLMRHIKQEENNEKPDYGSVIFKLEK